MPDSNTAAPPDEKSSETSFIQRCLNAEYRETPEMRTWDTAEFCQVRDPLNEGRYPAACLEAEKLLSIYPDFDPIYVWYATALVHLKQLDQAVAVAQNG